MPAASTLEWYARLPEAFRSYDVDGELVGFLDGLGVELAAIEALADRIDKVFPDEGGAPGDTSDLVDPATALAAWLPWVAMLYGVRLERPDAPSSFAGSYGQLGVDHATYADLDAAYGTYGDQAAATTPVEVGLTEAEQRALIASRPGWLAGSTGAIRGLVEQFLTGTKTVQFERSYSGHWAKVRVSTYEAETPEAWKIERVLARSDVAPAHVELTYITAAGATYGELTAEFASYTDLDAALGAYEDQRTHVPA